MFLLLASFIPRFLSVGTSTSFYLASPLEFFALNISSMDAEIGGSGSLLEVSYLLSSCTV